MSNPDLAEFDELSRCHPKQCVIARSIQACKGRDRVNLEAALGAPDRVSDAAVTKWLKKRNLAGSTDSVKKHRHADCCCV